MCNELGVLNTLIVDSKMIKMIIFMLCVFYHRFPWWLSGKDSACNAGAAGDTGSIPGSGRSPGGRHGNPLQDSCLENSMDRGIWLAITPETARSRTQLKRLGTHTRTLNTIKSICKWKRTPLPREKTRVLCISGLGRFPG